MLTLIWDRRCGYVPRDTVVHVGRDELQFLRDVLARTSNETARIAISRGVDPAIEEAIVIYRGDAHVCPRIHPHDDMSLLAVDGTADVLLFDHSGAVIKTTAVGDHRSCMPYFCRIPRGIPYTVQPRSNPFLCLTAISGPADDTEPSAPAWASGRNVIDRPARSPSAVPPGSQPPQPLISLTRIDPRVLSATDPFVTLSETENAYLLAERARHGLDRLRICVHKHVDERLHEMLMAFTPTTYVRPSLHVDKEESLVVVHGYATVIFFDQTGGIASTVKLGTAESGRDMYCRIPANTFHGLLVESDDVLLKETARGPFRRSDTVFPDWAPDGMTLAETTCYLDELKKAVLAHGADRTPTACTPND